MIGTVFAADVDVLAHLDRAFGADDHHPPVAPGREPIGGEPVDANIPCGAGRAQQHLAKILQLGMVRICPVGYGRGCHFGILCAGEEEELLDLVRGDISEDAAITLALEEPTGSGSSVDAMWAQPNGIPNRANCAGLHERWRPAKPTRSNTIGAIEPGPNNWRPQ